jgi:hypothetical protein
LPLPLLLFFAVAFASVAFAFLVVIPEGNLLLPLPFYLSSSPQGALLLSSLAIPLIFIHLQLFSSKTPQKPHVKPQTSRKPAKPHITSPI